MPGSACRHVETQIWVQASQLARLSRLFHIWGSKFMLVLLLVASLPPDSLLVVAGARIGRDISALHSRVYKR